MALYEDVLAALAERAVPYVVVGGLAVVLHGHVRTTVDLDLVVDLAAEPARAAVDALTELGFRPRPPVRAEDFADPAVRGGWVETHNLQVLSMYDPGNPLREVDLFATYPVPFDRLLARSVLVPVGSLAVRVASIDDLILMKQTAGRAQDLADVEALRALRERTGMAAEPDGWEAGTYEGARAAMLRDAAGAGPLRRLEWLEDALRLAERTGALSAVRRRRQEECDAAWSGVSQRSP